MGNILRALPIPLAITIVSSTITSISTWAISHPAAAVAANLVVFGLTFLENYLTKQEASVPAPVAVVSTVAPGGNTVTTAVPTPAPAPKTPAFSLDSNVASPIPGDTFTLSAEYGTPNGTFTIYEAENNQPLTKAWPLDANGNGSITYDPLDTTTPIGFLLSEGSVNIYSKDSAGKVSETITLG